MKDVQIEIPEGYGIDKDNSTFERIVFKKIKNKLPSSWEELNKVSGFYVNYDTTITEATDVVAVNENHNVFLTKEQANASMALAQLLQLRDKYRDGWVPYWNNETRNYALHLYEGDWDKFEPKVTSSTFTFQTAKLRDTFFKNFKDLLKDVKPLFI